MRRFLLLAIIAAVLFALWRLTTQGPRRKQLADERARDRERFVGRFPPRKQAIAGHVFDVIHDEQRIEFPLEPHDRFNQDLHCVDQDLDDLVLSAARRASADVDLVRRHDNPITTISDLVDCLFASRK